MTEIKTSVENSAAAGAGSSVLPEFLRLQYLNAMGIQSWFDPEVKLSPTEALTGADERIRDPGSQHLQSLKPEATLDTKMQQAHSSENSVDSIETLTIGIQQCQLCELHTTRKQSVAGEGSSSADLIIITDAPVGSELFLLEDKNMLEAMLRAIGIKLSSVYLTSLVKCQPPQQRTPLISEMVCCEEHLSAQVKLIQPRAIFVLGEQASRQLLVSQKSLTDLRLRQHKYLGVPVYASYHPHSLLDSAATKRKVWTDLLQISKQLG